MLVSVALDQFVAGIPMEPAKQNRLQVEKFTLPLYKNQQALSILTGKKLIRSLRIRVSPGIKSQASALACPGLVDAKKGINYTFLKVSGSSITEFISDKTGLPVFIDNDSSLIALAELRFGAAMGKKNAMVINIGWGVGLGLVLNGELFRGHNGFAGEFSHIPLFANGKLCSCGKTGCLETETSLLVIIEKAKQGLSTGRLSILKAAQMEHYEEASETIIAAIHEGDRFAVDLFSEAGYNIGRGVAILIHILNPELIILSGRGSTAGKIWQAPIQQALNEHCIPEIGCQFSYRNLESWLCR